MIKKNYSKFEVKEEFGTLSFNNVLLYREDTKMYQVIFLSLLIGFFVTALTLIYDKLNVTKLPKKESIDRMSVNKRPSSVDIIRMKQEHNYVIRFFYSIGFNILFATITLLLLIPNIFWKDFFSLDISEYGFVHKIKDVDCESILLGGHIVFLFVYRLVVILLIANVFFYTVYMITSLLQVLILKKKI